MAAEGTANKVFIKVLMIYIWAYMVFKMLDIPFVVRGKGEFVKECMNDLIAAKNAWQITQKFKLFQFYRPSFPNTKIILT